DHLLERATLVTPNRQEAERLSGLRIATVEDMDAAARAIGGLGPKAVLLKGGHMRGPLVYVFYDGERIRHLRGRRLHKELHGAGSRPGGWVPRPHRGGSGTGWAEWRLWRPDGGL